MTVQPWRFTRAQRWRPLNKVIHPGGEHHSARRIPIARRHRRKVADIDPPEGGWCFGEGREREEGVFSLRPAKFPSSSSYFSLPLFRLLDHSTPAPPSIFHPSHPSFIPRFSPLSHRIRHTFSVSGITCHTGLGQQLAQFSRYIMEPLLSS